MLSLQGPNQLTTGWEYDAFGRQIKERRADGTQTRVKRVRCSRPPDPTSPTAPVTPSSGTVSATISFFSETYAVDSNDKTRHVCQSLDGVYSFIGESYEQSKTDIEKPELPANAFHKAYMAGNIKAVRIIDDERENLRRNLVQQRRAVDYSDCGGGSSCVVSNQGVRNELDKLNNQLTTDNSGHVSVSGGDSRYDSAIGKSVSNSTGLVIRGRNENSSHNDHQGNRGVDIRGNTINIPRPDLDHYIERHTDFNVLARVYKDGHLHLTCHSKECVND